MRALPLLAALALLGGCTPATTLSTADGARQSGLNRDLAGLRTRVYLADGSWGEAAGLHVAPDVTTWVDPVSGRVLSAPTSTLDRVEVPRRTRGTLLGAALGVGTGLGLGALFATLGPDDVRAWITVRETGPLLVAGAVAGGVMGGAVGRGRGKDVVRFAPPAPPGR